MKLKKIFSFVLHFSKDAIFPICLQSLVYFILLLILFFSVSVIKELQGKQLEYLENYRSFSIVADGPDISKVRKIDGVENAYSFVDIKCVNKDKQFILRGIEPEYFKNKRFLSMLYYFDSDFYKKDDSKFMASSTFENSENIFRIVKGKSGLNNISELKIKDYEIYIPKYRYYDTEIVYTALSNPIFSNLNKRIAIYCKPEKLNGIKTLLTHMGATVFTWKEDNMDIYDALMFERIILVVVLSIMGTLVAIQGYKSTSDLIDDNEKKIIILKAIGMENKYLKCVFISILFLPFIIGLLSSYLIYITVFLNKNILNMFLHIIALPNNSFPTLSFELMSLYAVFFIFIFIFSVGLISIKKIDKLDVENWVEE